MNVNSILNYEKDPSEDFYSILGCDPESSTEQIMTEFKVRAKEFHPDKCTDGQPLENEEKFKQLLEVKYKDEVWYFSYLAQTLFSVMLQVYLNLLAKECL